MSHIKIQCIRCAQSRIDAKNEYVVMAETVHWLEGRLLCAYGVICFLFIVCAMLAMTVWGAIT